MNTVELAHRLTRHLSVADIGTTSPRQKQELAGEMTAGLMEYFENVPDVWSRTTLSHRIAADRTVTAGMVQGSSVLSDSPFLAAERGRTVVIGGASDEWNEVTGEDSVLDEWTGATGAASATVYPDCIAIQDVVIKKIVSDPRIHNEARSLVRISESHRSYRSSIAWRRRGTPTRYWIEYGGQSQGSDLVFLLRLDPIPTVREVIRFEADHYPNPVNFVDVSAPRTIPVGDGHANLILIPLIEARLIGSSMWNGNDKAERQILKNADRARVEMMRMPAGFARPASRVRTRAGW